MLNIIKNPSKHNFSKSPVMAEIETDNYFESGANFGNKARGLFYITVGAVAGNYIRLVSTALTIQLDFQSYVNPPTAGFLRTKDPGDSPGDFFDKIQNDILLNASITALFTPTYDQLGGYTFDAINAGPQYSLNSSVYAGTGFNYFNYVDGTDDIRTGVKPNYKIILDIFLSRDISAAPVYDLIYSCQKEPIVNGKIKVDLSRVINAYLDYYFPTPNLNTATLCTDVSRLFYIGIKEVYGTPPVEQTVVVLPAPDLQVGTNLTYEAYILKAGLSPLNTKVMPWEQLSNYVWNNNLFLTTRTAGKMKLLQPEYLYFCLPNDVPTSDLSLKIITFYADNTRITNYDSPYTGDCLKGMVLCFPVNPSGSIIRSNMINRSDVTKFEVALVSDSDISTLLSQTRTYFADYDDIGEDRIFLFTNSLGGVDTLRTTGYYDQDNEFDSEVTGRNYYTDDLPHLGSNTETQVYKQGMYKCNSGWLTQAQLDEYEELFLAKYRVELIDIDTYAPIIITTKKYNRHRTNKFLKAVEFEYYHQLKSPVTDKLAAAL